MKLAEGKKGKNYIIENIDVEENLKRRLEILGMTNKTEIQIMTKDNSSMIIKLRGNRFAISKLISEGIEVTNLR